MHRYYRDVFDPKTPLIFADGTKFYEELAQEFIRHDEGFFISAPSGAGKTHFVNNQKEKHWIDGDYLWCGAHAHPSGAWWLGSQQELAEIGQRSEIITTEAKKLGFWIVGASNMYVAPDAIVVPDWEQHKKWIIHRETHNYDGGAKSSDFAGVERDRKWILAWQDRGVPKFETMAEAAAYLAGTA